jgi:hypothetical protein
VELEAVAATASGPDAEHLKVEELPRPIGDGRVLGARCYAAAYQ